MLNIARSMLKYKNLPKRFQFQKIVYILNRCPTKKLHNVTPHEAWTGSKPCVKHFRVFGTLCFRHLPYTK
jgi:hypothetical protein